ncbi:hypothetical protein TSAR_014959, partial [Trichomalopsis sarcophagae]
KYFLEAGRRRRSSGSGLKYSRLDRSHGAVLVRKIFAPFEVDLTQIHRSWFSHLASPVQQRADSNRFTHGYERNSQCIFHPTNSAIPSPQKRRSELAVQLLFLCIGEQLLSYSEGENIQHSSVRRIATAAIFQKRPGQIASGQIRFCDTEHQRLGALCLRRRRLMPTGWLFFLLHRKSGKIIMAEANNGFLKVKKLSTFKEPYSSFNYSVEIKKENQNANQQIEAEINEEDHDFKELMKDLQTQIIKNQSGIMYHTLNSVRRLRKQGKNVKSSYSQGKYCFGSTQMLSEEGKCNIFESKFDNIHRGADPMKKIRKSCYRCTKGVSTVIKSHEARRRVLSTFCLRSRRRCCSFGPGPARKALTKLRVLSRWFGATASTWARYFCIVHSRLGTGRLGRGSSLCNDDICYEFFMGVYRTAADVI